jgi:hypothetical protein
MSSWAPLALTGVTAALLVLPVAPALYELRKRRDAAPLPTSRHDGRIANFADAFRSRLEPLFPQLEQCSNQCELSHASIEGMEVLLAGCDGFDFRADLMKGVSAVMCGRVARVPAGSVIEADVYAEEILELGRGAALRAAMGEDDIVLGENSAVLRWAHAHNDIYLRQGSMAYGRLSAEHSIFLSPGSGFQRMHAPQIFTVDADQDLCAVVPFTHACQGDTDADDDEDTSDDRNDDRNNVFASRERLRVQGDFVLPAGHTLNANVIATGNVRIGPGARFFGSAKSYKDTIVQEGACVHGSIVCGGRLSLGKRCFVAGPLMAESDVLMERGTCIGAPTALTTVSSSSARIAAGCQLHGTVWARVQAEVGN